MTHVGICVFRVILVLIICTGCNPGPQSPQTAPSSRPAHQVSIHDWVLRGDEEPATPPAGTPQRIVSAAPRNTEILCALGLRGRLVGRTRYCSYPPSVAAAADIGDLAGVNVERLLELKPDLILVSGASRAQSDRLAPLGVPIESLPDRTLDDLFVSILRVGELLQMPKRARQLNADIQTDLELVAKSFGNLPHQNVLLLIGTLGDPPAPPFVAGPGSFYDELLKRLGQRNAVDEAGQAFGALSFEYILKADPDVIIELDPEGRSRPNGDADALRVWKKVGPLKAVKDRRVRVLRGPQHYLIGPRIAETLSAIGEAVALP